MINMRKTVLATAVAAALGVCSIATAQAALVSADVMTVTSGSFGMGVFTGGGFIPITDFGSGAADIAGQYNAPGWDTNVAQTAPGAGTIGAFLFGTAYVNTYTEATATQAGVAGGGPAPSGMFDDAGGTTTFDMSSFFANWNGTDFNQGNAAATLVTSGCTATGCDYTMSWTSLIVGGAFNGQTGSWQLNGTVSAAQTAVPVPAAVWLLGSGLVGLVGVARRRKAA